MHSVILLPGLACDEGLWQAQLPALAERHRVVVSDVHTRCDSIPAMAEALLAEHDGALVLVGSSMGGMVAMACAQRAPHRVRGLALLGTSARPDTPELLRLRSEAIVLFEQGRMDEVLRANVMFAFHPSNAARPVLVQAYLDLVRRAGAAQLIRQNRAVMARADLRPGLPAITCPTLVVCGRADQLTPPACSEEIAAAIPGARLAWLDDCGHLITMEQPQRCTEMLLQWLDALPSSVP